MLAETGSQQQNVPNSTSQTVKSNVGLSSLCKGRIVQQVIAEASDEASRCHERWVRRRNQIGTSGNRLEDIAKCDMETRKIAERLRAVRRDDIYARIEMDKVVKMWSNHPGRPSPGRDSSGFPNIPGRKASGPKRRARNSTEITAARMELAKLAKLKSLSKSEVSSSSSSELSEIGQESTVPAVTVITDQISTVHQMPDEIPNVPTDDEAQIIMGSTSRFRRRLPEVPRILNRFRDQKQILGGFLDDKSSGHMAQTTKRRLQKLAVDLGLEPTDWDVRRIYEMKTKDFNAAMRRKQDATRMEAAVTLQKHWKGLMMRKTYIAIRTSRSKATACLQKFWRNKLNRQRLLDRLGHIKLRTRVAVRIQSWYRGIGVRFKFRSMLTVKKSLRHMDDHVTSQWRILKIEAITTVQAVSKKFLAIGVLTTCGPREPGPAQLRTEDDNVFEVSELLGEGSVNRDVVCRSSRRKSVAQGSMGTFRKKTEVPATATKRPGGLHNSRPCG